MRSWLYCPGNNPGMIVNAGIYGADGIVLDLEDAVLPERKAEARALVSQALREDIVDKSHCAVRINGVGTDYWMADLEALIPAGAETIRLPKVETVETVRTVSDKLLEIERKYGLNEGSVSIQCIFETPLGVENCFSVGSASSRIEAFSFGAEDYCASLGISRGRELFPLDYPRSRIASAAAAFGLEAYDTVWGFINDPEGLEADSERGKKLGFCGKSVIHPDQIDMVNKIFLPTKSDFAAAERIIGQLDGMKSGAVSLDGRMIDKPVIERAFKTMKMAQYRKSEDD